MAEQETSQSSNPCRIPSKYTHAEVDDLKEENKHLAQVIKDVKFEMERNAYTLEKMDLRHEKLEAATRTSS